MKRLSPRICAVTSQRVVPTVQRMPISRDRSTTDDSIMLHDADAAHDEGEDGDALHNDAEGALRAVPLDEQLALVDASHNFDLGFARLAKLHGPRLHACSCDDVADGHALPVEHRVDGNEQHVRALAGHDIHGRGRLGPKLRPSDPPRRPRRSVCRRGGDPPTTEPVCRHG